MTTATATNEKLTAALAYAEKLGWAVLPLHSVNAEGTCTCGNPECDNSIGKHPRTKNGHLEATKDLDQITRWWAKWPDANIGVRTGAESGIVVIDIDPRNDGDNSIEDMEKEIGKLPDTVVQQTGSGGRHLIFNHPGKEVKCSRSELGSGIDVKGDDGYIVVAPSSNANGPYVWELSSNPLDVKIADLPQRLEQKLVENNDHQHQKPAALIPEKIPEGERNSTLLSVAGSIRHRGCTADEILPSLMKLNERCQPPLPPTEVEQIAVSVSRYAPGENGTADEAVEDGDKEKRTQTESQASRLGKLVRANAELFHDQHHTPHARVRVDEHYAVLRCKSQAFKNWMVRLIFLAEDRVPGGEAIKGALDWIEALAELDGDQYELHNRVAVHDNAYWLDLTDEKCRAVKITGNGWEIVNAPPILFTRYSHQAPQVEPVRGGNLDRLFDFLSVTDNDAKLLIKTWLVSCLVPNIPHPIPVFHGPQGSGKTSIGRILRRLIDPSSLETLSFPQDQKELVQKLAHHYVALFDNVDTLQPWQSDALCRACTGEGVSKRQIYTDDEDFIYSFRRCVGLNGINIAVTRADLLDRSILIGLERIARKDRRAEEDLEAEFVKARPHILGGMLDVLSKAIAIKPTVKMESSPRMADFNRWGCAIAMATGSTASDFDRAYRANIRMQNSEVLDGHPVAAAVLQFMSETTDWDGQPAELLVLLEQIAETEKIDIKAKAWPKAAHILTRRLNEVKPNLADVGIIVTTGGHAGDRREIRIHLESSVSSVKASAVLQDNDLHTDATDGAESGVKVASDSNSLQDKGPDATDATDATLQTAEVGDNLRTVTI